MRLQQRQARETGICPVRRELYSQCFGEFSIYKEEECITSVSAWYAKWFRVFFHFVDELIRQVTINCAERGLLLLRYS